MGGDGLIESRARCLCSGVGSAKVLADAGDTVNDPVVPLSAPWVAVSVVLWASGSVIDAVPTPAVKFTVAGVGRAVPFGAFEGPVKVTVWLPV